MITFGAKALFESTEVNEIHYTPQDVDDLITRVENTADNEDRAGDHKEGMSFGFAKIWEASHAAENADDEDKPVEGEAYFWEEIVKRAAEEKEKEQEKMGRGAKRTRNQKVRRLPLSTCVPRIVHSPTQSYRLSAGYVRRTPREPIERTARELLVAVRL
jgi:hypothetical protein